MLENAVRTFIRLRYLGRSMEEGGKESVWIRVA